MPVGNRVRETDTLFVGYVICFHWHQYGVSIMEYLSGWMCDQSKFIRIVRGCIVSNNVVDDIIATY